MGDHFETSGNEIDLHRTKSNFVELNNILTWHGDEIVVLGSGPGLKEILCRKRRSVFKTLVYKKIYCNVVKTNSWVVYPLYERYNNTYWLWQLTIDGGVNSLTLLSICRSFLLPFFFNSSSRSYFILSTSIPSQLSFLPTTVTMDFHPTPSMVYFCPPFLFLIYSLTLSFTLFPFSLTIYISLITTP